MLICLQVASCDIESMLLGGRPWVGTAGRGDHYTRTHLRILVPRSTLSPPIFLKFVCVCTGITNSPESSGHLLQRGKGSSVESQGAGTHLRIFVPPLFAQSDFRKSPNTGEQGLMVNEWRSFSPRFRRPPDQRQHSRHVKDFRSRRFYSFKLHHQLHRKADPSNGSEIHHSSESELPGQLSGQTASVRPAVTSCVGHLKLSPNRHLDCRVGGNKFLDVRKLQLQSGENWFPLRQQGNGRQLPDRRPEYPLSFCVVTEDGAEFYARRQSRPPSKLREFFSSSPGPPGGELKPHCFHRTAR